MHDLIATLAKVERQRDEQFVIDDRVERQALSREIGCRPAHDDRREPNIELPHHSRRCHCKPPGNSPTANSKCTTLRRLGDWAGEEA